MKNVQCLKTKQFLKENAAIYCFDIDGVLAPYEYGENNHNVCLEADWKDYLSKNDIYAHARPVKTLREFIRTKDVDRIFVITKAASDSEFEKKSTFVIINYQIKRQNIIRVNSAEEKLSKMNELWSNKFKNIPMSSVAMVDDTVDTLNYIQENSNFATMHVSSFLV